MFKLLHITGIGPLASAFERAPAKKGPTNHTGGKMMKSRVGRLALGLATVALPLSVLAAPASATSWGGGDHGEEDNEPSISIKDVSYRHGDIEVKVKYRCFTDEKDDHGHHKGKHSYKGDDDEAEDGTIEVTLWQRHAKYSGEEDVTCDGEWGWTKVELDRDYGHLKRGKAWVKAKITDPQDETDSDREEVYVKKYNHHRS